MLAGRETVDLAQPHNPPKAEREMHPLNPTVTAKDGQVKYAFSNAQANTSPGRLRSPFRLTCSICEA